MKLAIVRALVGFAAVVASAIPIAAQPASVLEKVRARGYVSCGVGQNAPGFSQVNGEGRWRGLDVEFCAALATAVLGNKNAVRYIGLTVGDRFKALQDGEVDVLARATAWTLTRDSELGARFAGVLFYDGQAFLAPRSHSIASVFELSGASICVLPGSSGQRAVEDFFGQRKMRFQLSTSERWDELVKTYAAGRCTVLTGDLSVLAQERSRLINEAEHVILPELISKEPLGPSVRTGDDQWFSIVRWTYMALIAAEEMEITSSNVESMKSSPLLDVRRFLGLEANLGTPLGLAQDWAYQVVKQVGNYSEIFERTLGMESPLKLERGLNALWSKGGLMYAAPFR